MKLYIELMGGLGNQIFQYSFGIQVKKKYKIKSAHYCVSWIPPESLKNSLPALLTKRIDSKGCIFNNYSRIFRRKLAIIDRIASKFPRNIQGSLYYILAFVTRVYVFREEDFATRSCEEHLNALSCKLNYLPFLDNVIIRGYWQSYENISQFRESLLQENKFLPFNQSQAKHKKMIIAAHLRRGDYLSTLSHAKEYASLTSIPQYINFCLNMLEAHIKFSSAKILIITDDKRWAEYAFLYLSNRWEVCIQSSSSAIDDWQSLNSADLVICSNSTFSYTAAALRPRPIGGEVLPNTILPLWFNTTSTIISKGWDTLPHSFVV